MIPVLAHKRGYAWPGKPDDKTPPMPADYMPIAEALTRDFRTDAHCQACSAPTVPHRLRKAALAQLPDGVTITALFVDVDGPDHKADDTWWQAECAKLEALFAAHPGGFVYRTRGGYRLVWLIEGRTIHSDDDDHAWSLWYHRSLLYLCRRFGIVGDPACSDWTRLYRLPHATRDPKGGEQ